MSSSFRLLRSVFACACVAALALIAACGQTSDLVAEDMGIDQSVSTQLGEACGASSECVSDHCVDGVCCDTACTGECEACNVTASKGTCSAVPDGTDPAMECMPKPIVDVDGGTDDGGTQLNLPDAGIGAMDPPCAPKCNGNRACGFPGESVTCGDTFCNTSTELGAAVCDGEGRCSIKLSDCVAYSCGPNACKTTCTSNTDCLDTHFCNASGACQEKKDLGISCGSNPDECASGFCADGVCCNSDCGSISGGKCNNVGFVGTCKCTVTIPINKICDGTCEYYYQDADGDGHGKASTSVVGCTGDPDNSPSSPPGYVTNHDDCADDDARVHPGADLSSATNWISAWQPSFDWNCDGTVTREHPYRPGATCKYCNPKSVTIFGGGTCGGTANTSSGANQYSYIYCGQAECGTNPRFCTSQCCGQGCSNQGAFGYNTWAFVSGGSACGSTGTIRWCGMGAGSGSPVPAPVEFSGTQACK